MKHRLIIVAGLAIVLACHRAETPKPAAKKKTAATPAAPAAPRTEVGDRMPSYAADYIDGTKFDLAADNSEFLLLNVWATWCGPCRAEMPELQKLYDAHKTQSFKVVGVSVDETEVVAVKQFVDEEKISFPIAIDPEGRIANILQTTVLPTSVLLDRNRKILWRRVGVVRANDLKELQRLIGKSS
jgi:thiol-disulfide isomerase/thioredoxin